MDWTLGQYIEETLHKRGGKRAGWSQARLAELSRLSASHVSWIVTGEASGKKGPPEIKIETLIALAKGLGVKEQALIDAYKGDKSNEEEALDTLAKDFLVDMLRKIPPNLMAEAIGGEDEAKQRNLLSQFDPKLVAEVIIAQQGEAKMRELLAEAKRQNKEKDRS